MSAALNHPPASMALAEFLAWNPGDPTGRRWQLIDGEPVAMAPASDDHGSIQGELARLLGNYLLERGGRCRVVAEPGIIPRIRAGENWRVPDLAVSCTPSRGSLEVPEPVLLVEILSPNIHAQTRANVWTCTTLPSVAEILVVDSTRIEAELLRRGSDGTWPEQPEMLRDGERLELASVAFAAPLRALYRTTSLAG
jgi:Uma2 family endonuclease